jgi:hypothetical protein
MLSRVREILLSSLFKVIRHSHRFAMKLAVPGQLRRGNGPAPLFASWTRKVCGFHITILSQAKIYGFLTLARKRQTLKYYYNTAQLEFKRYNCHFCSHLVVYHVGEGSFPHGPTESSIGFRTLSSDRLLLPSSWQRSIAISAGTN